MTFQERDALALELALTAWAKMGQAEEAEPHALICHTLDTFAAAEALYEIYLGPKVRRELEDGLAPLVPEKERKGAGLPARVRTWVCFLCAVHDIGKLTPTFQALRHDRAVHYLPRAVHDEVEKHEKDPEIGHTDTYHPLLSAAHMGGWLKECKATPSLRERVVAVLGGHHGLIPDRGKIKETKQKTTHLCGAHWREARDRLLRLVAGALELDLEAAEWHAARLSTVAATGLAGLTVVSDWTASDENNYTRRATLEAGEVRNYLETARGNIEAALERVNWKPWHPPEDTSCAGLFPGGRAARPLQQAAHELLSGVREPGILVLQAPTGEGKTKAGFIACATLVRALGLTGAYTGSPNRALSRDVHEEANAMLEHTGSPLRSHLLYARDPKDPGSDPFRLTTIMPSGVWDDSVEGAKQARNTFAVRRGIIFPYGVGTIDQVLKTGIRSKFVVMRLAALSHKALLLDEVHAYDAHMAGLLETLLWWCGRLGVPVVMLSATLTAVQRRWLVGAWRSGAREEQPPAPGEDDGVVGPDTWQLTWATASEPPRTLPVALSEDNPVRGIRVSWAEDDHDAIAEDVLHRVREGGCAAVIHNTLGRVEETHKRLAAKLKEEEKSAGGEGSSPEIVVLTGRLSQQKRRDREDRLHRLRGPDRPRKDERYRVIVIGTQVLEHGIDVDFDYLVTDPAPMDYLLQRMGRLHRHGGHERPGPVREPEVSVVPGKEQKKGERTFPGYSATLYAKDLLLATEGLLSERTTVSLPHDIPDLVHAVYVDRKSVPESYRDQAEAERPKREHQEKRDRFGAVVRSVPILPPDGKLYELTHDPVGSGYTRASSPGGQDDEPLEET